MLCSLQCSDQRSTGWSQPSNPSPFWQPMTAVCAASLAAVSRLKVPASSSLSPLTFSAVKWSARLVTMARMQPVG